MRTLRLGVCVSAVALILGTGMVTSPSAGADSGGGDDTQRVRVFDDCDPASFNAALGSPDACVGDGETTFDDFIAELVATGAVEDWKFKPDDVRIDKGDGIHVVSRGGEFHTFTEVANFGGGCVPELNGPGVTPVPECAPLLPDGETPVVFATTGVPAGGDFDVDMLTPGTHKFECLIHPWMRSTVQVRADDAGHHHH